MTTFRSFSGASTADLGFAQNPAANDTFDTTSLNTLNIVFQDNDGDTNIDGDTTNEQSSDGDQFVFIDDGIASIVDGEPVYLESSFTFTVGADPTVFTGFHFESDNTGFNFVILPPGVPAGTATVIAVDFNPVPNQADFDALVSGDEVIDENLTSIDLSGADTILGDGGNDTIDGGGGADSIQGQDGADSISGGEGADSIRGGEGADTIQGNAGVDVVDGGTGDDVIDGGADDDVLDGAGGDDFIVGGAGNDFIDGGQDRDFLTFNESGDDGLAITDAFNGFPTTELTFEITINADAAGANSSPLVSYAVTGSDNELFIDISGGTLQVIIDDDPHSTGIASSALFDGTPHTLSVSWDSTNGELITYIDGVEADSTTGIATGSTLTGGGRLSFGQDQDIVGGNFNPAQILEGDLIEARLWDDVRSSTEIADNFDTPLVGNEGNLVSNWVPALGDSDLTDITGNNTATLTGDVQLIQESGNDTLAGNSGDDSIDGGEGDDLILGGEGSDSIDGSAGADTLFGDEGADTVSGGEGADLVRGGADGDIIDGNDGADTLLGETGDDTISGGIGNDSIDGNSGSDSLSGGDGDDVIIGDGDERVAPDVFISEVVFQGNGEEQNEFVEVTARNDLDFDQVIVSFYRLPDGSPSGSSPILSNSASSFFPNQGEVTLQDIITATGGVLPTPGSPVTVASGVGGFDLEISAHPTEPDYLVFTLPSDIRNAFSDDPNETEAIGLTNNGIVVSAIDIGSTGDGGVGVMGAFSGGAADGALPVSVGTVDGSLSSDGTFTSNGAVDNPGVSTFDTAPAVAGDDTIDGGDGDDTIEGNGGADLISGGEGADSIDGGDGDDSVDGGAGADVIEGGDGADTLEGGRGNDTVRGQEGADFTIGGLGSDLLEGGAGADTLQGDQGRDTLDGGDDNDLIDGGSGNDTLTGGAGDDIFTFDSDGNDVITDFNAGNTGAIDDGDQTNNDFINLKNFYDNLDDLRADFDDDGELNHSTGATGAQDITGSLEVQGVADSSEFTTDNTNVREAGAVCFTAGMKIRTDQGQIPVEHLAIGDLVKTYENGLQPVRFIYRRKVISYGAMRPVVFEPGAIGNRRRLIVSQQHRFLVSRLPLDVQERIGVEGDHLVKAIYMVDGMMVKIADWLDEVEYFHLMFDEHELLFCDSTVSESWQPHVNNLDRDDELRAELLAIFPEIASKTSSSGGGWVRPEIAPRNVRLVSA